MIRRHAPSYKCQRCWAHNASKDLARLHEESGCAQKDRPTLLMDRTQESKLEERMDPNLLEEEKWWILFCIAHPDLSPHEVNQLKAGNPFLPCTNFVSFSPLSYSGLLTEHYG